MSEDFDEDVVFENSPLFQYLHDLGHTDFEACPIASQEEEYGGKEGELNPSGEETQKTSGLWRLAERLCSWSHFSQASHKLEQQLDSAFGQYSVRCILDQDVLLQEDVELIELLDPGLLAFGSSRSGSPSRASGPPKPSLVAGPSQWDAAALAVLAAALLGLYSSPEGFRTPATVPFLLALLCWVGARGAALWKRGRMQRAVHARSAQLQALVQNGKNLTGVSRKALRLVQETEVISRGFTLVSAANSFSRASRGQQLIGLRKALYRALRSAFRASRRATCHMLKAFPLNSEIDNVTNYVCAVPLKELGLGLGIEHLGDEQAQELTDDYSLPALKMLFQLWVGQSSECYRRLALLLSPRRIEEEGNRSPPALHRAVGAVAEPLHQALASCLGEVRRSYDFHRHFEIQPKATGSDRTGRAGEKCRELNGLHASIRSLQLHLKAVLSEMIILEDDLEKLMVSKEAPEPTAEGYQELSDRLHQLQPHMHASAGCWEDAVGQVERMLRRVNASAGEPGNATSAKPCEPPEVPVAPPSYPLILDRDPVPEEQEWEVYVSDSDSDAEAGGSWSDALRPEERERQRTEREESRRVLSELKAVLGFRASEGERMKRKQLLFNDQAAVSPSPRPEVSSSPSTEPLHPPDYAAETGSEEEKQFSDASTGNDGSARPDPSADLVTEFSCGSEKEEPGGSSACGRGGGGAGELHQYDGSAGDVQNGPERFLKPKVPAISLMDRLTEMHGSETLSFSSALALQVAARSQSLINMEEQTFGDEDEKEESDQSET